MQPPPLIIANEILQIFSDKNNYKWNLNNIWYDAPPPPKNNLKENSKNFRTKTIIKETQIKFGIQHPPPPTSCQMKHPKYLQTKAIKSEIEIII